jgi:hypothetical protein
MPGVHTTLLKPCECLRQPIELAIRANLVQPPHSVITDHRAHVHKVRHPAIREIHVYSRSVTLFVPHRWKAGRFYLIDTSCSPIDRD